MSFKYVFGPVKSSRLGLSLGLDLLGDPICSFDCLYCECGPTKYHTCRRKPYAPAGDLLDELSNWLDQSQVQYDHITLGGLGEPCLNSELEQIILGIKEMIPTVPVAVLTNSSLLGDPLIREELCRCQVILPSVDTLIEQEFRNLNRPCSRIDPWQIASNLLLFRSQFAGKIFLEILLIEGINDTESNLAQMHSFTRRLNPHRIDVVTMTRPGTDPNCSPVSESVLQLWRGLLEPKGEKSISQERSKVKIFDLDDEQLRQRILISLKRRPQSISQLAWALGIEEELVARTTKYLLQQNKLCPLYLKEETFFKVIEQR